MITEDKKFLDLDHICDQITNSDDRAMFNEAIKCYQIGSHRAAIILAWCATVDCLYRRIDELASEGDEEAKQARISLKNVEGQAIYEENLINLAKKCELFDDYEEKSLKFARDTRSKCAHPSGVIPSAETVRHIFHTCSQTVLCRNGYRGMSFVKYFINTKLDDKHLFSDKNNISDTCKYYFYKVPEKIRPQFASLCAEKMKNGCSPYWRTNVVVFFRELMNDSPRDLSAKIAAKLHAIESTDIFLFSILVGLDQRENVWDETTRTQAKAHLSENLTTGIVDSFTFQSYATLCSISRLEDYDKELLKNRFLPFSEHISKHIFFQKIRRSELLSIIMDSLDDSNLRQQTLVGVGKLVSEELFADENAQLDEFVEILIESDWREDAIRSLLLCCSDWCNSLKVSFLKKSKEFLEECSEDYPDDILVLFDIVNSLLRDNPLLISSQFESTIKELIDGDIEINWFKEQGEAWRTFVGQVGLIKSMNGMHFPIISALSLPNLENEEYEETDE